MELSENEKRIQVNKTLDRLIKYCKDMMAITDIKNDDDLLNQIAETNEKNNNLMEIIEKQKEQIEEQKEQIENFENEKRILKKEYEIDTKQIELMKNKLDVFKLRLEEINKKTSYGVNYEKIPEYYRNCDDDDKRVIYNLNTKNYDYVNLIKKERTNNETIYREIYNLYNYVSKQI